MGHTKEQLLSHFQELGIEVTPYDHPVVLTVEAALKYVGHVDGAFCKNLFFKDKKKRYYIVSALPDTKVDIKVLSQRLGLGKGGIRMAPEEALSEVLQVPLGCVTPFALFNESARHVSLLLDQGLRSQKCCLFHPLTNDMSVAITATGLDKFLKSIGREPAYVDLEANPPIGKDQPPDLAAFVPSDAIVVPELGEEPASAQTNLNNQSPNISSASVTGKSVKNNVEGKKVKKSEKENEIKDKSPNTVGPSRTYANTELFVEEILNKTTALILSQVTEETVKKQGDQLEAVVSERIQKSLAPELSSLAMIFKNAAYTEGFHAATDRVRNLLSLS